MSFVIHVYDSDAEADHVADNELKIGGESIVYAPTFEHTDD